MYKLLQIVLITILLNVSLGCGGGGGGGGQQTPVSPIDSAAPVTSIDPGSIDFEPYYSGSTLVSFEYPSHFGFYYTSEEGFISAFIEHTNDSQDPYSENIAFIELGFDDEIAIGDDMRNVSIVSTTAVEVDGKPAQETVYDAEVFGNGVRIKLRLMQIAFVINSQRYALVYAAAHNEFDRYVEVVRYMATTVQARQRVHSGLNSYPTKSVVASDGNGFIAIGCREEPSSWAHITLVATIVKADRSVMAEFPIHSGTLAILEPCINASPGVAFDGNNYFISYVGTYNGKPHIMAKRISIDGEVLDQEPIHISTYTQGKNYFPSVAFDGENHIVVWNEVRFSSFYQDKSESYIWGAVVSPQGELINTNMLSSNLNELYPYEFQIYKPQLAIGASESLVIWSPTNYTSHYGYHDGPIYAVMVDFTLMNQGDSFLLQNDNGGSIRTPQVVYNNTGYFIAWIEEALGLYGIYGKLIPVESGLKAPSAVSQEKVVLVPESSEEKKHLNAVFHEGDYYFLWSRPGYSSSSAIYLMKQDAAFSDRPSIAPIWGANRTVQNSDGNYPLFYPDLAFSNHHSFAVWTSVHNTTEGWFLRE